MSTRLTSTREEGPAAGSPGTALWVLCRGSLLGLQLLTVAAGKDDSTKPFADAYDNSTLDDDDSFSFLNASSDVIVPETQDDEEVGLEEGDDYEEVPAHQLRR